MYPADNFKLNNNICFMCSHITFILKNLKKNVIRNDIMQYYGEYLFNFKKLHSLLNHEEFGDERLEMFRADSIIDNKIR